jgi:hypothetical protein
MTNAIVPSLLENTGVVILMRRPSWLPPNRYPASSLNACTPALAGDSPPPPAPPPPPPPLPSPLLLPSAAAPPLPAPPTPSRGASATRKGS